MTFLTDATLEHLRGVAATTGDLEGSRYRIREEIGRGGMGTVYRAEDEELGRAVALKVLRQDVLQFSSGDQDATERLRREARVLARLEHPGIVPVHDVGLLPDGRTFYTMKLVEGERLDQVVARGTPLPRLLRIFERLCEAVAFAHDRGIVHRDLKPENVMVGSFGEVLALDWGVAKILASTEGTLPSPSSPSSSSNEAQEEGSTAAGTIVGTPGYMAPEQAAGASHEVDSRTDVYALGALLRFLLTGRHPWQSTEEDSSPEEASAVEASANLPKRLRAIAERALETKPEDRYQKVSEVAAEISRYLTGDAVGAYRETLGDRVLRFYRRHKVAILLVAAYLLMRVVLFAVAGF